MLTSLSIRDVVLIDRLDLNFCAGLNVLTGETGAGKSVLLDSLSLALGMRAETALVRHGAKQASVRAEFSLPENHPVYAFLEEKALPFDVAEPFVLRRVVFADGKSKAFVNDEPVSVGVLRQIGDMLVEIHGQFAGLGLLNAGTHKNVLDTFGKLNETLKKVRQAYEKWRQIADEKEKLSMMLAQSKAEEDFIRHCVDELTAFSPKEGEETLLADKRALMMNSEKLIDALRTAKQALSTENGIRTAQRALERVSPLFPERFESVISSLETACEALNEASFAIDEQCALVDEDPRALEMTEERLFAMRSLARKYQTTCDGLVQVLTDFQNRLSALDKGELSVGELDKLLENARSDYIQCAEELSEKRKETALRLDRAVQNELAPLKLEKAVFKTLVDARLTQDFFADGTDDVRFVASINPGQPAGALDKIASGGELARFMLALKVVLAQKDAVSSMVFDEVDSGVGGATASAVGERLDRLASDKKQILVVTHSPQVAAFGMRHFYVSKSMQGENTRTNVVELTDDERREEIARMLSGAVVTEASRAAAEALLNTREKK